MFNSEYIILKGHKNELIDFFETLNNDLNTAKIEIIDMGNIIWVVQIFFKSLIEVPKNIEKIASLLELTIHLLWH